MNARVVKMCLESMGRWSQRWQCAKADPERLTGVKPLEVVVLDLINAVNGENDWCNVVAQDTYIEKSMYSVAVRGDGRFLVKCDDVTM